MVVEMGPANDKVEVLDPLPVPLTAHLGGGSDKLIGNAEPDTCYPQGTRRNRCIGGGGNDVCITGAESTATASAAAGNDYCKTAPAATAAGAGPATTSA